jgi:hypothetical protein
VTREAFVEKVPRGYWSEREKTKKKKVKKAKKIKTVVANPIKKVKIKISSKSPEWLRRVAEKLK